MPSKRQRILDMIGSVPSSSQGVKQITRDTAEGFDLYFPAELSEASDLPYVQKIARQIGYRTETGTYGLYLFPKQKMNGIEAAIGSVIGEVADEA